MDRSKEYAIGSSLSTSDRFLTLVTCIQHEPRYREVVLCKETRVEKYDG
jgi:hypothetical protein